MGKEGQVVPEMPDSFVEEISARYIELYEQITGETFIPAETSDEQTLEVTNKTIASLMMQ
jgi:phosphoribosylaminoimidazole-succinocarboxamide synthase